MKKYILSAFLALAVLACLLPCVALQAGAEESETTFVKVEPTAVTTGTYLISGTSAVALDDGADTLFMTTENCEDNRLMGSKLAVDGDRVTTGDNECMWELVEAQDGFYIKSVAKGTYLYWNEDKGGNAIYQTETVDEASVWQMIRHENSHADGSVTTDYTLVQADGRGLSCNRFGSERNRYLGFAAYDLETTNCLCSLTFYKAAEPETTYIDQGTCGNNLTWTLTDDGVLIISGTGAMSNYNSDSNTAPWFAKRTKITEVVIEYGVTSIGYSAFSDCSGLTSISIGDGVTSIGDDAFYRCSSLWHVLYTGTEENWNAISIGSSNADLTNATRHYECTGDEVTDPVNKVCTICAAACQHQWQDATCTAPKTCALCGETEGDALGHSYESAVMEPACEEAGYTLYTCVNCGDSYGKDYVEALGHNYEYAEIAPTCTRQGYTLRTCANCADSYIDNFTAAIGHSYTAEVVAATCTQVGYTISTCDLCGRSEISDFVDAIGHEMSNWIAVLSPTCTEVGAEQRHCAYCEYSEARETAATGHSYEARVIAATCTDMGFTIHTCHCGDGYVDTFTEITDHSYVDGVCEHCGEIDPDAVLLGDANGDGTVNYLDAMVIAQFYVGDIEEDGLNLSAADVNGDGVVNYLDAMMVAQFYVGDIDEFPAK